MFNITLTFQKGFAFLCIAIFFSFFQQELFAQCGCTYTVPANQYAVDGNTLNIKPGDVICLAAGTNSKKFFTNIVGTPTNPVTIKNCGGLAYITAAPSSGFGINFSQSRYFHLTGAGDAGTFYGIEIDGSNQGIDIGGSSSDFEVDHIEVHGTGYAGFAIKTNPSCNTATWRENYIMENVKIHDNYVYSTTGEGFYVGNSHYHFPVDVTCAGVATKVWEHSLRNVEVYNNIVENSGRDGIQVGGVIAGGKIYNNRINGFGTLNPDHINGIQVNPGFTGVVSNNIISGGVGYGIQSLGNGVTIFNNVAENCGAGGIFVDDRGTTPGVSFNIFNNTLVKNGRYGLYFLSLASANNKYHNNIVISDGSGTFKYLSKHASSQLLSSNNLETTNITSVLFQESANDDYHIKTGSPAIDAGKDMSAYATFDLDNNPRPSGSQFDIGAYEFQSAGTNQNPTANAGSDRTITLPTNSLTLNGFGTDADGSIASYAWTKVTGPTATLSGQNTANLALTNLLEGDYVFRLTVKDNKTATGTDQVTVHVKAAGVNQLPIVNAGTQKTISLPISTTTLTGSATDADGSIKSYLWTKISGPSGATLANGTTPVLLLTNLVAGSYVFRLRATDDDGGTGFADATLIVQTLLNQAPTANAGTDKKITQPASSTALNGTGTDSDGTISSYKWTQVSGPNTAIFNNASQAKPTISGLIIGSYVLGLVVTDNLNKASLSDKVTVTVSAASTQKVVSFSLINADNDQVIQTISSGSTINLSDLPTNHLNIRANTNPAQVGSVKFALSGAWVKNVIDGSLPPYALFGDRNGNYNSWTAALGNYSLTATPFSAAGGKGTAGTPLHVNFSIIKKASSALARSPSDESPETARLTNGESEKSISAYPNPFHESIHLRIQSDSSVQYVIKFYDNFGRLLMQEKFAPASPNADTHTLNLPNISSGMHIIVVESEVSGYRKVMKVWKE